MLALLAALLFPVLAAAKRSGKKTGSLSNERQQYIAIQLYAMDHDDTFAFGIPRFWSDKRAFVPPDLVQNAQVAPFIEDVLVAYGFDDGIEHSPGDPGLGGSSVYATYKTSYSYRLRAFLTPLPQTAYESPADRVLIHEAYWFFELDRGPDVKRIVTFHDGHVKYAPWRIVADHMDE